MTGANFFHVQGDSGGNGTYFTNRLVSYGGGLTLNLRQACGIAEGLSSYCARLSRSNSHFLSQYSSVNASYPFVHHFTQLSF